MPIRVDHDARRAQLAQAVWSLVGRDGVAAASVRAVARETGLSMGSVRHFFASQDELLLFAVEELVDRARQRIAANAPARMRLLGLDRPVAAVAALLEEVLPLDAERRAEARVWAAFTLPPVTGPGIDAVRAQVDAGVRDLCGNALDALHELDRLHVERDRRIEVARLHALLDGLTLHLTAEPPLIRPAGARAVVLAHVGDLAATPST